MSENYKYIKTKVEDYQGEITLSRLSDNSLTIDMMRELIGIHNRWANDRSVRGVILLSDIPNYFSNGLDIATLLKADLNGKKEMFLTLIDMVTAIYGFYKPHIALVTGHAMGGGAVLASLSDYRYMADGPYRISFSEIKIGLSVPLEFIKVLESITGPRSIQRLILMGEALKPGAALEIGLIDSVVKPADLKKMAKKQLHKISALPLQSYIKTKMNIRKEIVEGLETGKDNIISYISGFFDDTFNEGIAAIQEKRRPRFNLD
ncbi:MAG: enoyl-CoA hydratase/isomerase family protein [Leptospirales bacterium]